MTKLGKLQCYDVNKYIKNMQICLNYYWETESFRFLNQADFFVSSLLRDNFFIVEDDAH